MRVRSRNDTHPRTPHTYMHPRTRSPHCLHPRTRSPHFLIHSVPLTQKQAFYAKHDPSKTQDEIRELVRKYKKGNPSPPPPLPTHTIFSLSAYSCSATVCCARMHIHAKPQTGKFLELCRRLHSKYSEHPASFAPSVSEL